MENTTNTIEVTNTVMVLWSLGAVTTLALFAAVGAMMALMI